MSARAEQIRAVAAEHPDWNLRMIAEKFETTPSCVWKALHPERAAALDARHRAKRRDARRQSDRERRLRLRRPCPGCGEPMSHTADLCQRCVDERNEQRRALICELWADGLKTREIAVRLGTNRNALAVTVNRMRAEGYDLPYRCRTYAGRPLAGRNGGATS